MGSNLFLVLLSTIYNNLKDFNMDPYTYLNVVDIVAASFAQAYHNTDVVSSFISSNTFHQQNLFLTSLKFYRS